LSFFDVFRTAIHLHSFPTRRSSDLIYVICGEGRIDIVQQQDADRYALLGSLRTAPRARTGLWVAETARLYVAAPAMGGSTAAIRDRKSTRLNPSHQINSYGLFCFKT